MPVVTVQFEVTICSGFLEHDVYSGELQYRDDALTGHGTEQVPVESLSFRYRGRSFDRDGLDSVPIVAVIDGVFEKVTMVGGPQTARFGFNDGFQRGQFGRPCESWIRSGGQYFGYLNKATYVEGAGTIAYRVSSAAAAAPAPEAATGAAVSTADVEVPAEIVALLAQPPAVAVWDQLLAALSALAGDPAQGAAVTASLAAIAGWPLALPTFAPRGWCERPLAQLQADPITPLVTARLKGLQGMGPEILAQHKASKLPSGFDLGALGPLRWRGGAALDEADRKRLIAALRAWATAPRSEPLERLRQLLDDADCQRWSAGLLGQWEAAGRKSAHKWALWQLSFLGSTDDIPLSSDIVVQMSRDRQSRRMADLMDIKASSGLPEVIAELSEIAMRAPVDLAPTRHAVEILSETARARQMTLMQLIQRSGLFDDKLDQLDTLVQRIREAGLEGSRAALGAWLEHAMTHQREIPLRRLRGLLEIPAVASVLWCPAGGKTMGRWTEGVLHDVKGKPIDLAGETHLVVAHPVLLTDAQRRAWAKVLEAPLFPQLDRPTFTAKSPPLKGTVPMPTGAPTAFYDYGWTISNMSTGCEYSESIFFSPPDQPWIVELDVDTPIFLQGGQPFKDTFNLTGELQLRERIPGAAADRVAYSEAGVAVQALLRSLKTHGQARPEIPADSDVLVHRLMAATGDTEADALTLLIRVIYRGVMVTGAHHDGVEYRELPNPWGGAKRPTAQEKALACTGSTADECRLVGVKRIVPDDPAAVTLRWQWKPDWLEDIINFEDINDKAVLAVLRTLPDHTDAPVLPAALTLLNPNGINPDHRGADHCLLALPWSGSVQLDAAPTLDQLVQALYTVKSHKFDGWYEMFSGSRVSGPGKRVTVWLTFDHGS